MNAILAPYLKRWPLVALLTSLAMLAFAHASETFGHLPPCTLCLRQREAHWIAAGIAAAGVVAGFTPWRINLTRLACVLLMGAYAYGLYLGVFHAGAEWKFWPGPAECAGGSTVNASDLQALLHGGKVHMPACDKALWVFLGLSMAGWNAIICLTMMALSAVAALRNPHR